MESFPDPRLVLLLQICRLLARENSVFDLELALELFQGKLLFLCLVCTEESLDRLVAKEEGVENALCSVPYFLDLLQNKRLSLAARVLLEEELVEGVMQLEQVLVQLEAGERGLSQVDDWSELGETYSNSIVRQPREKARPP